MFLKQGGKNMKDLTLKVADGILNVRVGAIIMKDGKFLMVGNKTQDYLYSVGGRVHFGETFEEAVKREVLEETGVEMEIDRLGFIHENFFISNTWDEKGLLVQELSIYFYMKTPEKFEPVCTDLCEEGVEQNLYWISPYDEGVKYYPEFFKTELRNPVDYVKHFVTK